MKETRPLAHPSPSATLSRHFFFFIKRNLLVDFKGSSASREIILVGSRGGRGGWRGRGGVSGWEGMGAAGNQPLLQCNLSYGARPSQEDSGLHLARGVTVRTQKSGLVFADREVRFGQGRRE